jgi:hypothetical protein
MKQHRLFLFTVLSILVLTISACTPGEAPAPIEAPPEPAAEEIPAPVAEPPAPDLGACSNPFYPVGEGRSWEYLVTSGEETSGIRFVQKDVSPGAFTHEMTSGDVTTEIRWTCGPDGLFSSEDARMNFAPIPNLDIETLDVSGVAIPPADKWQVGYSWESKFNVRLTMSFGDGQVEGEGEYTVVNTIAAIEPVSVPAGSYEKAYRVDAQANIKISMMGMETDFSSPYSSWFVEDIGMVKSASGDAEMPYSMELIALGGS